MKVLIALLLSFNIYASDEVVKKLIQENTILQNRIDKNNKFIKERNKLSKKISSKKILETHKNMILSFGFSKVNWNEEFDTTIPKIGIDREYGDLVFSGTFERAQLNGFPFNGQTVIIITKASVGYAVATKLKGLKVVPRFGYAHVYVNSPDAGIPLSDTYAGNQIAKGELDIIREFEDRKGFYPGLAVTQVFSQNWQVELGVDGDLSSGIQLGYVF